MPPSIPTPFPIPPPEVLTDTLNVEVFWQFDNIAPAISMAQSVFLWANYYNILVYSIILVVIAMIVRWIITTINTTTNKDDV